jgi:AcrR family transcriptional regulator
MTPRRSDARERMLDSAATLIRERGASGTSIDDVIAHSGAPRGSIYHHFPGGRNQIVQEAVERAGGSIDAIIAAAGDRTVVETFDAFLDLWRASLIASDYRAGCPVVAVAIEANDDTPQLREAAADAFASWRRALSDVLRSEGIAPAEARRLATLVVASVEGAVVLSRADRDIRPLDDVGRELRGVLRSATEND